MTRDGTAEPVSRDQILRQERGQGKTHFPCSADHEQDWQPYPIGPYTLLNVLTRHTYILHTIRSIRLIYSAGKRPAGISCSFLTLTRC